MNILDYLKNKNVKKLEKSGKSRSGGKINKILESSNGEAQSGMGSKEAERIAKRKRFHAARKKEEAKKKGSFNKIDKMLKKK